MEVFQNGNFSTGEPVYQIGTKNPDGTYNVVVFDLMTESEAKSKLMSMTGSKPEATVSDIPDHSMMSKKELETMMREHGVELDRRKTKTVLLKEVDAFFKDR